TGATGATGADGKSAFEVWQALPGNAGKTITDYLAAITGPTGATGATGADGKSAFEVWQALPGNAGKTITDYLAAITGATGAAGADGKTILNGAGAPSGATGKDGDFYIDPTTNTIYGPKAGGVWPAGVSIKGADGQGGVTQAGTDIAISGTGTVIDPYIVSNKITADNGLTKTAIGVVQLGGALTNVTKITTDATNTLAIDGLQTGANTDKIVVADANGVLRSLDQSTFEVDLRLVGNSNHITKDAGLNFGTSLAGTGYANIGIGLDVFSSPLFNSSANIGIGYSTLKNITLGSENNGIGIKALSELTTGNFNTAMGTGAQQNLTTGSANVAFGGQGLYNNTTGDSNAAFGSGAGYGLQNGNENTFLGANAGETLSSGSGNVYIGNRTGSNQSYIGESNQLYIHNVFSDKPLIKGDFSTKVLTINNTLKVTDLNSTATATTGNRPVVADASGQLMIGTAPTLTTADNGLTNTGSNIQLGGALTNVTKITTDATNTLAIEGLQTGAATNNLVVVDANGVLKTITPATLSAASNWLLSGNAGTNPTTNFIGTTDAQPLALRTNNAERMRILSNGKVGIGTTVPAARLDVQTVAGENDIAHFITGGVTTSNMGEVWIGNDSGAWASLASGNSIFQIKNVSTSGVSLHADLANNRIGIGNTAPSNSLHVTATADPLRLEGLQTGLATNDFIVADANGVLKKVSASALTADLRVVGMDNHITQDAGVGGNGSSVGTGANNLAIGKNALLSNTTGIANLAFGAEALFFNTDGGSNVALGASSLFNLYNGNGNLALGNHSFGFLLEGSNNIALGNNSGNTLTRGSNNVIVGFNTNSIDPNGSNQLNIMNSIFGKDMGLLPGTLARIGINQTAPTNTLHVTATADPLRLEGLQTGLATNDFIVADANGVLKKVSASALTADVRVVGTNNHISQDAGVGSNGTDAGTGANNIGIGINNFSSITIGSENIAIGGEVMSKNTVGSLNTAIGPFALHENTTGSENVAIGGALTNNTTGFGNIGIGQAGQGIITGNYNVVLGYGALQGGSGNGNRNIVVGAYAGNNLTTGSNNLILGDNANVPSATATHQMSIMNAIFGSGLNGTVTSPKGSIGINQPSPTNTLHVTATADPLRLEGLQAGLATNDIIVTDANGVIKKVSAASFTGDLRLVGIGNHITQDAGNSANGTSVGSGANNIGIGESTLFSNTAGNGNLALGNSSLSNFTSGDFNIAIGDRAAQNLTSGNNNISLGKQTDVVSATGSNQLNIMNSLFGTDMNGSAASPAGKLGINQTAPTNTLHVTATADPLRLEGLQAGLATDAIVVADANGVLKTVSNTTFAISTKTANYTALGTDETILVDASSGNVTITLPTTVVTGKKYYIKKIDTTSNDVIVDGAGATIDGSPSITGSLAYQGWVLQYNGTAWFIISRN
ncbi:beta strand repeat-containing protein, partial [Nubsella zeaxanthinifaciens]|uniref:beta strand repeat-containing protein n=1 Tax=Nubsella zeaxanthinifaciens TaxID=392412 RepID=UPI00352026CF